MSMTMLNEEPQASDVIALVKFNVPNNMHMKRECEHKCWNVNEAWAYEMGITSFQ
jgi:hypothetical protein